MNLAFELGVARGHKHFLYGGRDGVADKLKEILEQRFSGIQIVGTHCPPFRELTNAEAAALAHSINESGANVVWCGLGCPKQEHWMKRFRPLLDASVLIGVGAGFDFLSGEKPLAPRWIQHSGFEWAFRLVSDPARLWPRYSRVLPRFIYHAGIDTLRRWLP
jgi:N-acetylglucosaminyldiphosphoundecaprenol N-acetyl-beta-D-mannosaminyltransferase